MNYPVNKKTCQRKQNYEIIPTCNHYQTMLKSRTIMLTFLTTQLTFQLSGFRHQWKAKTTYNCVNIFTHCLTKKNIYIYIYIYTTNTKTVANKKDNEIRLTWKFYQTMQISSSEAKNINLVLKIRLSRLEYINAQ